MTCGHVYEKIDYGHNNPVRRGWVKHAASWAWSSCRAWETGVDEPIGIDRHSLPMLAPEEQRQRR